MKPEEQRIAIAKACGYYVLREPAMEFPYVLMLPSGVEGSARWATEEGAWSHEIPNYPEDLNAMHEAEKTLRDDNSLHGLVFYCNTLMDVCGTHRACVTATAAQRAEAFLRTIGKWKE